MALAGIAGSTLAAGGCAFYKSARFGALPEGDELIRLARSPHFRNGVFFNEEPTPLFVDDGEPRKNAISAWMSFLFDKKEHTVPNTPLPAIPLDLGSIGRQNDAVIWLGHSTVYMQLAGQRMLIDPVFSSHASPLPVAVAAFPGTCAYASEDFPELDMVLISHDHWDHLDYHTLRSLAPRIKSLLCPLGVSSHLARFGLSSDLIVEGDWGDSVQHGDVTVHFTTSRHFSGRTFTRNHTLWGGFAFEGNGKKIFFSGDGGYGRHFARIGERFGSFDLAMLDMGQYNPKWRHVHMDPSEAASAADELRCRMLLPVHIGKFSLSYHAWDAPFKRIHASAPMHEWHLLTPRMGEPVLLDNPGQFSPWWQGIA